MVTEMEVFQLAVNKTKMKITLKMKNQLKLIS